MSDTTRSTWASTHPVVVQWWADQKALMVAANEARDAWQAEHSEWKLLVTRDAVTGIATDSDTNPDPTLWRQGTGRSRQWGWWFPRAEGPKDGRDERRALLARFKAMSFRVLPTPGMPQVMSRAADGEVFGLMMCSPGATEHDGVIWCHWNYDADAIEATAKETPAERREEEGNWSNTTFNPEMWERRKLSEWHAMREAQDEAAKTP